MRPPTLAMAGWCLGPAVCLAVALVAPHWRFGLVLGAGLGLAASSLAGTWAHWWWRRSRSGTGMLVAVHGAFWVRFLALVIAGMVLALIRVSWAAPFLVALAISLVAASICDAVVLAHVSRTNEGNPGA